MLELHLCWGNCHGPHHHDVPLKEIVDILLRTKAGALSFEAANPRHQITDPKIAWTKLAALADGAALASRQLWRESQGRGTSSTTGRSKVSSMR